jgi:hypothetical protein
MCPFTPTEALIPMRRTILCVSFFRLRPLGNSEGSRPKRRDGKNLLLQPARNDGAGHLRQLLQ